MCIIVVVFVVVVVVVVTPVEWSIKLHKRVFFSQAAINKKEIVQTCDISRYYVPIATNDSTAV